MILFIIIFSERSLYAVARPSVCLSSVCRLSATLVRPTQPVEIFGNISTPFGTLDNIHRKFYGDRPRETPPSGGGAYARGVAKYSDF